MTHQDLPRGFKGKFNWLIDYVTSPDGDRYTDREIAEGIGVSANYVWRLRHDPKVKNPSLEVAEAIAQFFNVSLSFFEDRTDATDLQEMLSDVFLSQIAKRAPAMNELAEEDKEALLRIIDHVLHSQRT